MNDVKVRFSLATIVLAPRGAHATPVRPESFEADILWAAENGFAGIELSPQYMNLLDMTSTERESVRGVVEGFGLHVSGLNADRCLNRWNRLNSALEAAADCEAEVLTFALSVALHDGPSLRNKDFAPADFDRSLEVVAALSERAARYGVQLSAELHDDGLLDTATHLLEFINRTADSRIGVNPDLGNIVRDDRPQDWREAIRILAPRANCWHVKNYSGGRQVPLESGEIDYAFASSTMEQAGYSGWISFEVRVGPWKTDQKNCVNYFRTLHA